MHRRFFVLLSAAAFAAALVSVQQAEAGWSPDGVQLCSACLARSPSIVPDGMGGAFIAWTDSRNDTNGSNADIYMQHVTASGNIAPGWPADGVPVSTSPLQQGLGDPHSFVPDGSGGAIIAWTDYRDANFGGPGPDIYAQRVLADGTIAPGWTLDGTLVTRAPSFQIAPVVLADGTGGAYITWDDLTLEDIYLQHVTAAGSIATGWPADGLPVCVLPNTQGAPQLANDGSGSLFIAWTDLRDGPVSAYALRLTASGEPAPGWPADGVRMRLGAAAREMLSDGAGGAYISCATFNAFLDDDYFLQRFLGDGSIAPGWPADGVPVCLAPDERAGLRMAADGAGGALLTWYDYRDFSDDEVFLLRMRPDGTRAPGWPADGLRVTDNNHFDSGPEIASDAMGGAYLCWDFFTAAGDRVYAERVTGDATVAPPWPAGGLLIGADESAGGMRIAADGVGGAIIAWRDRLNRIRALRVGVDGPVPVAVSLVSAEPEPDRVRLIWFAADGASLVALLERRTITSDWQTIASLSPDGSGQISYEDRDVIAGTRYGYRLSYRDGAGTSMTPEVWVEVPALAFALKGLTPNPSFGDPVVAFTLASERPATLELVDVRGRRVESREVGSLGPGAHTLRLGGSGRLAAGVYSVRLRCGADIAIARAVVIR